MLGYLGLNREHRIAQLALRAWPFPRGSGRLTDRFFSHLKFSNSIETVKTTDGFLMAVNPSDLIGRHIYLTGEFDRSTFEILARFARAGDRLLDIGANVGYVSACFLHIIPNSSVIAIEPQPGVVDLLRANLRQFNLDRYQVVEVAISDNDGTATLQICSWNNGASRLVKDGDGIRVATLSAQRLIATIGGMPDLIKIDVEGHEETVLSSLLPAIGLRKPRAIIYEDHTNKSAADKSIGRLFEKFGYDVFAIKKRLTHLQLIPVKRSIDCIANDYIAISTSAGF